jgi:hypothetical protein
MSRLGDPAVEIGLGDHRLICVVIAGRIFLQPRRLVRLDRRIGHRREPVEQVRKP